MPPVGVHPPARGSARRTIRAARWGRAALACAGVLLGTWLVPTVVLDDPAFVPRVKVDNAGEYDIRVDIGTPSSASQVALGVASQRCTTSFEEVLDQGSTWVLRFRSQGRAAGELIIDRAQLERDDWTVRIPDAAIEQLRSQGVPRPPVHPCDAAP